MTLLVARWFVAQRGRAMALSILGMSLGGFDFAPIVGLLIEGIGWRLALIASGLGGSAVLLLLALVVRERPGGDDREGASGAASAPLKTAPSRTVAPKVGPLLRRLDFWFIALSTGLTPRSCKPWGFR
jgi:MFS family permease